MPRGNTLKAIPRGNAHRFEGKEWHLLHEVRRSVASGHLHQQCRRHEQMRDCRVHLRTKGRTEALRKLDLMRGGRIHDEVRR